MLDTDTGSDKRYVYRFAHCELSEATGELRVRGELVPLPPRDRAMLFFLVRRAGEFVSNEDAIAAVWGDYPASGKTVGNTILKVRQAIGDDDHSIIKNERNRGYIVVSPIEKTAVAATPELQLAAGMAVPGRPDCLLEEKIGTGGYGDVWLCKGPEGRSVFKFSKESAHESAIKREVTISRLLEASLNQEQRQHFLPIVEWDFEVWPSYVETPYAGHNLKAWAASKGGLKTIPLSERLEIMATIADAVGLAHSVGALHKDLKPENVLIEESDGRRQVRLGDFGAGHLLNREKLDQLAITVRGWTRTRAADATSGTLLWMAPELFEGATPTLQSDLYSLGVLLYQMVVGDFGRVLAPDWHPDITDELLREDIDIATRRNPAQRLGDAKELARRLRMLEERREEREQLRSKLLRTERAEEELKKARARRPFVWATAATLLVGLCTSSYFYYEQLQKTRAAQALSDFVADDFLNAALPANGGTATITLKDAMMKAVPLAKKRFVKEPDLEAKILGVFGNTMSDLGAYRETAEIMQRLAELDTKLYGKNSDDVLIDRLIVAYDVFEQGSVDEANRLLEPLRQEVQKRGTKSKAYPVWLQIESILSFEQSNFDRAVEVAQKSVAFLESRRSDPGFNPDELDSARTTLLQNLIFAGRPADALKMGNAVLPEISDRIGPLNSYALSIRAYLASANRDLGNFPEAEKEFNAVCPTIEKQNGADNKDALDCRQQQAQLFLATRRWAEAVAALSGVLRGLQGAPDQCGKMASCLYAQADLAYALSHTGDHASAQTLAAQSAASAQSSKSPDPTIVPKTLFAFAYVSIAGGQASVGNEAVDRYEGAIKQHGIQDADWLGRLHLLRAQSLIADNRINAARAELKESLELFQQTPAKSLIDINEANDALKKLP